jgi:hypothetical protein
MARPWRPIGDLLRDATAFARSYPFDGRVGLNSRPEANSPDQTASATALAHRARSRGNQRQATLPHLQPGNDGRRARVRHGDVRPTSPVTGSAIASRCLRHSDRPTPHRGLVDYRRYVMPRRSHHRCVMHYGRYGAAAIPACTSFQHSGFRGWHARRVDCAARRMPAERRRRQPDPRGKREFRLPIFRPLGVSRRMAAGAGGACAVRRRRRCLNRARPRCSADDRGSVPPDWHSVSV